MIWLFGRSVLLNPSVKHVPPFPNGCRYNNWLVNYYWQTQNEEYDYWSGSDKSKSASLNFPATSMEQTEQHWALQQLEPWYLNKSQTMRILFGFPCSKFYHFCLSGSKKEHPVDYVNRWLELLRQLQPVPWSTGEKRKIMLRCYLVMSPSRLVWQTLDPTNNTVKCRAPYYKDFSFSGVQGRLSGSCVQDYGSMTLRHLPES
jgi:hypothetical protein